VGKSSRDIAYMQEALALARSSLGKVWPNPSVGCLIVKDGDAVGRGATQEGGRPHAEIVALNEAGDRSFGATAYVSLEPCSHWGESPPCTDALIEAGIERVVVAVLDPDIRVNGSGIERLIEAKIAVEIGICRDEAIDVNAGFFHKVETGRPLVVVLEPDQLQTGDLFYGAAFFDALLATLPEWLSLSDTSLDQVMVVVDDPAIAPADLQKKTAQERQAVWLVTAKGRVPGRLDALRTYLQTVLEIDGDASGAVDSVAFLETLGGAGLTRVAVSSQSDLAKMLRADGLA